MHDPTPSSHDDPPSGSAQPYLDLAIETRFGYLREGEWLPLLVEFDPDALETQGGETPYDAFARLDWSTGRTR